MQQRAVLGLDGGGTTTRVACVRPDGTLLSYCEAGGANVDAALLGATDTCH
jgi:N-acetylglucosamine kinase-like BadF-type ATPase